ncbi:MAG: prepilin-type N-terminal cleavage/methylation domain-containing protein [Bacillota bacterium]
MLNEKGFTLIEIMIALTVLLIVVFTFSSFLCWSYAGIFSAGQKSVVLFAAQSDVEKIIAAASASGAGKLVIPFPGIPDPVRICGEEVQIMYEHEGRSGMLTYFLPE